MMKTVVLTVALLLQQAIPAPPENAVAGRVTYADGTPFAMALIALQPESDSGFSPILTLPIAFTGDSGEFRIKNIPPGRYVIRNGDSSAYYPGVATRDAATVLTVTAGSVTENLNFVFPATLTGFRVSGRVVQPANTTERATNVSGSSGTQHVYGNVAADGTFELHHVRPGAYILQASPATGIRPVNVIVDRDISGIEFALPKLFDIAGTVKVEGRANVAGLFDVRNGIPPLLTFDGPIQTVAGIEPDGLFKTAAMEGEYRIRADRLPVGYYIKALKTGERDLLTNRLQIVASEIPVQIAVTLAPSSGVKVAGKVTGMNSDVRSARIALIGTGISNGFETAIQPDGSYAFPLVMPGAYVARISSNAPLASPPIAIEISNKDVDNLEIAIPPPVNVSGRVTVDGNGPPPKFALLLAPASDSNWNLTTGEEAVATLQREAQGGGIQIIRVDVDSLPDGSFTIPLPVGAYRIATPRNGIPTPYVLKSISYAGVNLQVDPLTVSEKESSEILVGFGTTSQNPWSRVSGRVVGLDPGQGPFLVALGNATISTMEAPVNADGMFEFARVLQGKSYTARLQPENKAASAPRVPVGEKDVENVRIDVPREREITLRTQVEGGGPGPSYVLSLISSSSTFDTLVKPDSSGVSQLKLPEDERQVDFTSLPLGYIVKSVKYGTTELRTCAHGAPPRCANPPLKMTGNTATEIQVVFALDPSIPFGKISGRVTGLSSEATDARLVLSDAATYSTFEQQVGAGGSFSFSSLPQGAYVPSVAGVASSSKFGLLSPSLIHVNGIDTSGIEIHLPSGSSAQERLPEIADPSVGARVSEVGGTSRTTARESAAVATLRTITTAEVTYLAVSAGNFGTLSQMIEAQLLPESFRGTVNGFNFAVASVGSDFVVAAIPNDSGSARYGFYVTPDGLVRYSTIESLAPAGRNGEPVD